MIQVLLLTVATHVSQAQEPAYKLSSTAPEASLLARQTIEQLPHEDLPFTRFLWLPWGAPGSDELKVKAQANVFGLAQVSRASVFTRPGVVGQGRLLRIDMRAMCPSDQLPAYLELWEAFQFDPSFSVLITPDQVRLLDQVSKELLTSINGHECTVSCWQNDKRVLKKMKLADALAMKQSDTLIRVNGHHLDAKAHVELQIATKSLAPVVDARYFLYRALSTVQDDGLYKDVYGGLYYDLSGIRDMTKGGEKTDLDNFLAALGIRGGIQKLLDAGRADERAAVFRSNVTGRGRLVLWFSAPSSRRSVNTGLVMITRDLKQKRVDIGTHPILNLVRFAHDATEVIYERPDGTHGFVLFDAADKLQDEAPVDVVADRTVPEPHSPRLQSAISCIRCHGARKDSMGWQPVANDVQSLLKHVGVFGDFSERNRTIGDVLDQLKGRYQGNADKALRIGRDDYMAAVLRITGPWQAGLPDQTDVVVHASSALGEIYSEAWYDAVTPQAAMRDLGFLVSEDKAAKYLTKLLPPVAKASGIYPEDPRIAALCAGIPISRFDWSLVFPFASARRTQALAAWQKN